MKEKIYFVGVLVKEFTNLLYEIESQLLLARIYSVESVNKKELQLKIRRAEWYYLLLSRLNGFSYGLIGSLLGVGAQAVRERTRKGVRMFWRKAFSDNWDNRDQLFSFIEGRQDMSHIDMKVAIRQFIDDWKLLKNYQAAYYSIWPMYAAQNSFSVKKEILQDKQTVLAKLEGIYREKKQSIEDAFKKGEISSTLKLDIAKLRRMFATLARANDATYSKIGLALGVTVERARQLDAFGYRDFKYPHYVDVYGIERNINEPGNRKRKGSIYLESKVKEVNDIKRFIKKINNEERK